MALPPDTDRVGAVTLDVTERGVAVRCALCCGDSLYVGEERTSGDTR